jgi:hypothetical protein
VLTKRPFYDHVHDDPVRNRVAPAALKLGQQALNHVVGNVVAGVTGPDKAALDDDGVPRRDELGVVAGLEQQGVFGITSIAHPVWSHRHLRPILRRIQEKGWRRDYSRGNSLFCSRGRCTASGNRLSPTPSSSPVAGWWAKRGRSFLR